MQVVNGLYYWNHYLFSLLFLQSGFLNQMVKQSLAGKVLCQQVYVIIIEVNRVQLYYILVLTSNQDQNLFLKLLP